MEEEVREAACCAASAVGDVLRYLGDVSYAILPRDVAHELGDLKKAVWSSVRSGIDRQIEWIDERVAGGDRLRDEWQHGCGPAKASEAEPVN